MSVKFKYAEGFPDIVEYLAEPSSISAEITGDGSTGRIAQFYLAGHHNSSILKDQKNLMNWFLNQLHPGVINNPKKLAEWLEKKVYSKDSMEILPFGVLVSNGSYNLSLLTECHYRKLERMRDDIARLGSDFTDNKLIKEQIGGLQSLVDIFELEGKEFISRANDLEAMFPDYKLTIMPDKKEGGKE